MAGVFPQRPIYNIITFRLIYLFFVCVPSPSLSFFPSFFLFLFLSLCVCVCVCVCVCLYLNKLTLNQIESGCEKSRRHFEWTQEGFDYFPFSISIPFGLK